MVMFWASSGQLSTTTATETMRLVHGEEYYSFFLNISYEHTEDSLMAPQGPTRRCLAMEFHEDAIALAFVIIAVSSYIFAV